MIPNRNNL